MSLRPSEHPGGFERHALRQISHAELFGKLPDSPTNLLAKAKASDKALARVFSQQFEAVLQRAVALKPSEETEVVLAVKAELDRLYTVASSLGNDQSLGGEQSKVQGALLRLINLTMDSIQRAAGDDAVAMKELHEESQARDIHFKLLECSLVADLLNSHSDSTAFIPTEALIPTLLSAKKSALADVVQLFDLTQITEISQQGAQLIKTREKGVLDQAGKLAISKAVEKLEFIKGYGVYLVNQT